MDGLRRGHGGCGGRSPGTEHLSATDRPPPYGAGVGTGVRRCRAPRGGCREDPGVGETADAPDQCACRRRFSAGARGAGCGDVQPLLRTRYRRGAHGVRQRQPVQRTCGIAQCPAQRGALLYGPAAARCRRIDGRARRRGCRQGIVVRCQCGAGLLGDPREGLRGHCRHQPVHRPVG